jgi:uncharacterized protein YbaP (TraB family)
MALCMQTDLKHSHKSRMNYDMYVNSYKQGDAAKLWGYIQEILRRQESVHLMNKLFLKRQKTIQPTFLFRSYD